MSGKRQATSDLNHNNWDQEEEPEEVGQFKEASADELKNRVIKKARRRITDDAAANANATKSIFGGFTGFGKTTAPESASKSSPFSFLNKVPTVTNSANNFINNTQNTSITTTVVPMKAPTTGFSFGTLASSDNSKNNKTNEPKDEAYYAKVIKLNQSFCAWIKEHVDKQPLCNLMCIFKDYEKYWEQIKQEQPSASVSSTTTNTTSSIFGNTQFNAVPSTTPGTSVIKTNGNDNTTGSVAASSSKLAFEETKSNGNAITAKITPFTFGSPSSSDVPKSDPPPAIFSFSAKADDKPTTSTASTTKSFSFGLKKNDAASTPSAPSFSFGIKKDEKTPSSGFSFTSNTAPFSFGDIKPPAAVDKDAGGNDDDDKYEPPKAEVKEIVEEDAIFTKKCKVFVKENNAYKEFGIGTLYLKSIKNSTKIQLLVRSSNNLGTILVNLLLVEDSVVTQRVGKNNVMVVHPNKDGKTQTTLIRVKDSAEADELLEVINNNKK